LGLVVTPPALGVWPSRGPLQVLSREAVARLELVEPRSELLVRLSHGRVRLCLSLGRYLLLLVLASCALNHLLASVHLASEHLRLMWARGQGGALPSTAVHVSVPFHAAGVRFVGGLLGPLVGFLVTSDPAVAVAPSYFDPDLWLLAAEFDDVFSFRDGVSLSWARVVRGHPPYGRLSVHKYGVMVEFVPSAGFRLKGAGDGCAFRIVRFLYATHVDLEALPRLVLLPHDRVSGGASYVRDPSVKVTRPLRLVFGPRFGFDDWRGVKVFHRLQQHRRLPSVRMAQ